MAGCSERGNDSSGYVKHGGQVTGCSERGNDSSGYVKLGESLD